MTTVGYVLATVGLLGAVALALAGLWVYAVIWAALGGVNLGIVWMRR